MDTSKKQAKLGRDDSRTTIQTMMYAQGKVNITSGTVENVKIVRCVEAGSITITWSDESTDVLDISAMEDFTLDNSAVSVTFTSGTYHIG